jgi:hypothetical protein
MARHISPCRKRSASGLYRAIDICFTGNLNFVRDEGIVDRAVDGQSFAAGRRAVFAVDKEVRLEVGHGCQIDKIREWLYGCDLFDKDR